VPIEKIKVGDWVLSQPEMKGDLAYKRVVNTFVHEDKLVGLIDFFSDVETTLEAARGRLVATRDHPFWVKDVGWTRADHLEAEQILELHDGSTAAVWQYRELRNTEYKDVAWACEFHPDTGPIVDFRGDSFVVDDDDFAQNAYAASLLGGWTERRVFNIEVEGFHTYYVGELGVWVHNSI